MSKCIKHFVLRNFNHSFCISIGFCSVKHWTDLIKKSCFSLTDDIHNLSFFDDTFFGYNFDFEENYFKLKKEFRHMSLFSICLHFLRCTRSCDKKSNYCRVCSRVRENFFLECNAFSNLCVCSVGSYLDCSSSDRLDLDVFLLNADDFLGGYTKYNGKCCYFQNFEFARDLFAAFCSVLIRMFLNYTVDCFSDLLCRVTLSDEQKIIQKILNHAYFF